MRLPLTGLLLLGVLACATVRPAAPESPQAHATALPFIVDDYSRALAEARAQGRPLFVDTWAPW